MTNTDSSWLPPRIDRLLRPPRPAIPRVPGPGACLAARRLDNPEQAFESGYPVHDRWTIAANRVEHRPPSVEITRSERGQPALGGGRPTMPKPPHLATVSATRPLHLVVCLLTSPPHRRIVPGSPDTYRDARS